MKTSKIVTYIVIAAVAVFGGKYVYDRYVVKEANPSEGRPSRGPGAMQQQVESKAYVRVRAVTEDSYLRTGMEQNTSLEAIDRVTIYARVSGRLESLEAKAGDVVKTGQVIAVLDHKEQSATILSVRAQIASAAADTKRAQANMRNALTEVQRYRRLVKEGYSTQQQLDVKETEYAANLASYNASVAKEDQLKAELTKNQVNLGEYTIVAPIDGTILNDYSLTVGAMISPSTPVAEIANLDRLKAVLRIPENRLYSTSVGAYVDLRLDAIPSEEFRGKITRIDQFIDPRTRTASVEVELDNKEAGGKLRPGMFGRAFIIDEEVSNSIVVPESAIHTQNGRTFVRVEDSSVVKTKDVTLGIRGGGQVQVLSGLDVGDMLIVFGGNSLKDGDVVEAQIER